MGTKSQWRKGKLVFSGDPMITSAGGCIGSVVTTTSTNATVLMSDPMYSHTLNSADLQFRVTIGGVISSSSGVCTLSLKYNSTTIETLAFTNTKAKSSNAPWQAVWEGSLVTADSTIAKAFVTGQLEQQWSTHKTAYNGSTAITGSSNTFNLKTDSTLGLNVTAEWDKANGKGSITACHGRIEYFN